jgi:hypothetical protein
MGEITCAAALVAPNAVVITSAVAIRRIAEYLMILSTSLKGVLTSLAQEPCAGAARK